MDGFVIERKFYCKELGIIKRGEDAAKRLDIGLRWADLSAKNLYVSNETHTQVAVPCLPRMILLIQLKIPDVNLKDFGCPKVNTCSNVEAFAGWLKEKIKEKTVLLRTTKCSKRNKQKSIR